MGLVNITLSTLLSGGIIGNGTLGGYLTDSARRALGMGLAELQDGQVHYFSKNRDLLKRALIQSASQTAYGLLRSYPRYMRYWEQRQRDKYLQTQSQSSLANKNGQHYQLIKQQKAVAAQAHYTDTIVGRIVADYLRLYIDVRGVYYDNKQGAMQANMLYGASEFIDLQPQVQVSSKNNVLLTTVQGRDYTRKELVSGGDLEIAVQGKITSKYPDVYPEAEVSKFLKLMQYRGVLECENTILRQFNIQRLIVQSYALTAPTCRNIQPYTLQCVAVEPSEAVEVKHADREKVDMAIKHTNKWIKYINYGAKVIDPTTLLSLTQKWL